MEKLTGTIQTIGSVTGSLSCEKGISGELSEPLMPKYSGKYQFTPSASAQVIRIKDKTATKDIVIEPIPSNYGLVTYNGSFLTIS